VTVIKDFQLGYWVTLSFGSVRAVYWVFEWCWV